MITLSYVEVASWIGFRVHLHPCPFLLFTISVPYLKMSVVSSVHNSNMCSMITGQTAQLVSNQPWIYHEYVSSGHTQCKCKIASSHATNILYSRLRNITQNEFPINLCLQISNIITALVINTTSWLIVSYI